MQPHHYIYKKERKKKKCHTNNINITHKFTTLEWKNQQTYTCYIIYYTIPHRSACDESESSWFIIIIHWWVRWLTCMPTQSTHSKITTKKIKKKKKVVVLLLQTHSAWHRIISLHIYNGFRVSLGAKTNKKTNTA